MVIRTSKGTVGLETSSGTLKWLVKRMSSSARTIYGGRVYMARPNTEFRIADLESGETRVETPLEDRILAKWGIKDV